MSAWPPERCTRWKNGRRIKWTTDWKLVEKASGQKDVKITEYRSIKPGFSGWEIEWWERR